MRGTPSIIAITRRATRYLRRVYGTVVPARIGRNNSVVAASPTHNYVRTIFSAKSGAARATNRSVLSKCKLVRVIEVKRLKKISV